MTNRKGVTANCPCAVCWCCGLCDWWDEMQAADTENNGKDMKGATDAGEERSG